MFGKLAGAWLGEKIAGQNQGAKGAILGYGAAALARRSVPDPGSARARRMGVQEVAKRSPRERRLFVGGRSLFLRRVLEIGLDLAIEL